jgi:hypothetical protein
MNHEWWHDPLVNYRNCTVCFGALSAAFAKLADLELGPKDTDTLIRKLREIAEGEAK